MVTATRRFQYLVDPQGNPLQGTEANRLRQKLMSVRRELVRAKYDAAQTTTDNSGHWANADHLDPHSAASYSVRKTLRARSRYEVLENNPFLKGVILTLANDFVGRGPRLQITDKRISKARRRMVEQRFHQWLKKRRIRQKLWRMRMAKMVDGESFLRAFRNRNPRHRFPVQLDFQVLEADRVSSENWGLAGMLRAGDQKKNEVDGVRFDQFELPTEYHVLKSHPGGSMLMNALSYKEGGDWVDAKFIIHWFRQDRGWLRGIPETTPSLPHCAILRRYTLAMVQWAEVQADITALIESEGPANTNPWTDGAGNQLQDDPFDVFPIERGMVMNLPWGYKAKQLQTVPLGAQYDEFVGSQLREIVRPLMVPHNLAIGTSKDSNMASAIVDQHIYREGQDQERVDCEEVVLDHLVELWWGEAVRLDGYLGDNFLATDNSFRTEAPDHVWRWDPIGLEHTDPAKVAKSLIDLRDAHILTDRDIQETRYNRDVEDWREEVLADAEFRKTLSELTSTDEDEEGPGSGSNESEDEDEESTAKESQTA